MTKEEKTDIKVGVTVLLGTAVLLFGIGWAKSWTLGAKEQTARAIFATAGGLQPGDPVTVNGVKWGTVQDIKLEQADVIVTMAFTKHVDLRRDATASIAMLELIPGHASTPLPDSALIPGIYSGDISSLVAMLTMLSGTLGELTGKADTLFTSLNSLLQGDTMKSKIGRTLDAANATLAKLGITADHANTMLVEDGPGLKRTIEQADAATRDLSQALAENRPGIRMFIDSGGRAVAEGRAMLAKANALAMKLDSMIAGGGKQGTLFYKLMKDPDFSTRIDNLATSVTKLAEQLRLQGLDANIRFWNSTKPDTSKSK